MIKCSSRFLTRLVLIACIGCGVAVADRDTARPLDSVPGTSPFPESTHQSLPLSREQARHLLARSGIGVSPSQLLALQGMNRQQAVETIVDGLKTVPEQAMPDWVDRPLPHYYRLDSMGEDERQRFNMMRDAELSQMRQWWVAEMLGTSSPQTERLVFFWHDLFATSYHAIGNRSRAMALQNRRFRELGSGSWETLLKAMIRDPALLDFLDNNKNRAKSPNENLARELLELFTLGEGNYDETTVRSAARSLTGMSSSDTFDDAYLLQTWHHDRGEKTLFGETARFDGDGLIDVILDQPAAAQFLVRRFWLAFISDVEPPENWVQKMAEGFRLSDYDVSALYSAVLSSDAFWAPEHRGALIKSPLDLVIGTARALEYPKWQWQSMATVMGNLEMDLFAPPNVAGWSEGAAFITAGRLLDRQYALDDLVRTEPTAGSDGHRTMSSDLNKNPAMGTGMSQDMTQTTEQGTDTAMTQARGKRTDKAMDESEGMKMATGSAMPNEASTGKPVFQELAIRIAAENYKGPARIRVELGNGDSVTWASDEKTVLHGIDTLRYGRMQGIGTLPWHDMPFEIPVAEMQKASTVSIVFLNDDAGEDGDRNVYVDGITLNDQWIPAAEGKQIGNCPPEMASDAGYLYCEGSVTLSMPEVVADTPKADLPTYRASAVQLRWASANEDKNRQSAVFILDHVVTPTKSFDLVSFELIASHEGSINLRISSFACLPACFERFADCAWQDALFPEFKSMSFPLARRLNPEMVDANADTRESDPEPWCNYDALPAPEQALVAILWRSVPALMEQVRHTKRGLQFEEPLTRLVARLQQYPVSVDESFWTQVHGEDGDLPSQLVVSAAFTPPDSAPSRIIAPERAVHSLDEWVAALGTEHYSLQDVLLPGVAAEQFDSLTGLDKMPAEQQLQRLLDHPVFQVR